VRLGLLELPSTKNQETENTMSNNNGFVVDSLRPERIGGGGGIYQLTENSVNPTVITGVDEAGMPIEETVPTAYHRKFVANDGGINSVPLRTAAVFSREPEAERYEHMVVRDIVSAGFIPLTACPYTFEYKHIKGGPLAKIPPGESDCGGRPGATDETNCCPHLQTVIKARRAMSLAKHQKQEAQVSSMKTADVERMQEGMVKAFGQVMATHLSEPKTGAAKARLRDDKGE
jgi:hypothetical protein